jgi:hypothetical protein
MSNNFAIDNPKEIINKKARVIDDDKYGFGLVKEVREDYIIIEATHYRRVQTIKVKYSIPMNLVDHFDGDTVYFGITKEELEHYKRD